MKLYPLRQNVLVNCWSLLKHKPEKEVNNQKIFVFYIHTITLENHLYSEPMLCNPGYVIMTIGN